MVRRRSQRLTVGVGGWPGWEARIQSFLRMWEERKRDMAKIDELILLADKCNKALKTTGKVYLGRDQPQYARLPTGIIALDYVMGGGLPKSQLSVFEGEESTFKTTAAINAIATMHSEVSDSTGLWVAGEGFDRAWAGNWGVDLDRLLVITANSGDTSMETAVTLLESGHVDIAVIDSFQSLGTEREMEGGVDSEAYAGAGAPQMWGRVMRRVFAAMNRGVQTALIGITQVRSPIGKRGFRGMPPEPEGTGINAIKHWKAINVRFKKGELYYEGENEDRELIGRQFKLRCTKNKTAVSERVASFDMLQDTEGAWVVDNVGTAFRLGRALGFIESKGSWFTGLGHRAQGEENFIDWLREDEEALEVLMADIREKLE